MGCRKPGAFESFNPVQACLDFVVVSPGHGRQGDGAANGLTKIDQLINFDFRLLTGLSLIEPLRRYSVNRLKWVSAAGPSFNLLPDKPARAYTVIVLRVKVS